MSYNIRTTDLTIDSRDRNISAWANTDKYDISLMNVADPIRNIHSIEIIDIYIPETQRLIDKHNNQIIIQFDNETKKIILPSGDYSDTEAGADEVSEEEDILDVDEESKAEAEAEAGDAEAEEEAGDAGTEAGDEAEAGDAGTVDAGTVDAGKKEGLNKKRRNCLIYAINEGMSNKDVNVYARLCKKDKKIIFTSKKKIKVKMSFKGNLWKILGFQENEITIQKTCSKCGTRPMNLLKNPYVFIGLENVHFDERQLVSPMGFEYFGKHFFPSFLPRNMSKQIRVFERSDAIRSLDRLRISILNQDNSLYQTHYAEHTFTLRIKMII